MGEIGKLDQMQNSKKKKKNEYVEIQMNIAERLALRN